MFTSWTIFVQIDVQIWCYGQTKVKWSCFDIFYDQINYLEDDSL